MAAKTKQRNRPAEGPQLRRGKVYMGAWIDPKMKEEVRGIARAERRSLNAQVEFFLALGVQHLKAKQAA